MDLGINFLFKYIMSIVAMRRKINEKNKANKRKQIKSNYTGYHTFLQRKNTRCLCPDSVTVVAVTQRNVVKDRVNKRKTSSQKILDKKLSILQRIRCDEKNGTAVKKEDFRCIVAKQRTAYTKKETILRFCNTTKDLKIPDSNSSYASLYDSLKTERAFRCTDQTNVANNKC